MNKFQKTLIASAVGLSLTTAASAQDDNDTGLVNNDVNGPLLGLGGLNRALGGVPRGIPAPVSNLVIVSTPDELRDLGFLGGEDGLLGLDILDGEDSFSLY